MKQILVFLACATLMACGGSSYGPIYDLKGYDSEGIGGGAKLVSYQDAQEYYLAQGSVINGVRNGAWVTYHHESNKIKSITNYVNGVKNGVQINMNDRGQIESMIGYKNDILHGVKANYKFGRPTDETSYKDGKVDGPFAVYNNKAMLQKKGSFKNGKQHGKLQFFDEEGNVTLEYVYDNGEKISGGIVEKSVSEE